MSASIDGASKVISLSGDGVIVERLLVSGYVELDADIPRVRTFPRTLLLACEGGNGRVLWNSDGSLSLSRENLTEIPTDLLGEPSITPVYIDVTENYFGENQEIELLFVHLHGGDPIGMHGFKFIEFEFSLGVKLQVDPCWSFGFTLTGSSTGR